jgi:hypothetical protein
MRDLLVKVMELSLGCYLMRAYPWRIACWSFDWLSWHLPRTYHNSQYSAADAMAKRL